MMTLNELLFKLNQYRREQAFARNLVRLETLSRPKKYSGNASSAKDFGDQSSFFPMT